MHTPLVLSKAQVEFYDENGYLVLEALTTLQEVEWLRGIYDRLFEERAGRESGDQFDLGGSDEEGKIAALPQILNPSRYAPELKNGWYREQAIAAARSLLGDKVIAQGEHAIFKPPLYGAATPWHQDEAYWNPALTYRAISIWIPLQEATIENGCMHFIPGSHRRDIQPHRSIDNDPRIHGLEVEFLSEAERLRAVACPIPAGGCTIHHNRTLHFAGPNTSSVPRRAYILGFGLPPVPHPEPRRFPWNEAKTTARDQRAKAASTVTPP